MNEEYQQPHPVKMKHTIAGIVILIVLGMVGFMIGQYLDGTKLKTSVVGIQVEPTVDSSKSSVAEMATPKITVSASPDNVQFVRDTLTIPEPGNVYFTWDIEGIDKYAIKIEDRPKAELYWELFDLPTPQETNRTIYETSSNEYKISIVENSDDPEAKVLASDYFTVNVGPSEQVISVTGSEDNIEFVQDSLTLKEPGTVYLKWNVVGLDKYILWIEDKPKGSEYWTLFDELRSFMGTTRTVEVGTSTEYRISIVENPEDPVPVIRTEDLFTVSIETTAPDSKAYIDATPESVLTGAKYDKTNSQYFAKIEVNMVNADGKPDVGKLVDLNLEPEIIIICIAAPCDNGLRLTPESLQLKTDEFGKAVWQLGSTMDNVVKISAKSDGTEILNQDGKKEQVTFYTEPTTQVPTVTLSGSDDNINFYLDRFTIFDPATIYLKWEIKDITDFKTIVEYRALSSVFWTALPSTDQTYAQTDIQETTDFRITVDYSGDTNATDYLTVEVSDVINPPLPDPSVDLKINDSDGPDIPLGSPQTVTLSWSSDIDTKKVYLRTESIPESDGTPEYEILDSPGSREQLIESNTLFIISNKEESDMTDLPYREDRITVYTVIPEPPVTLAQMKLQGRDLSTVTDNDDYLYPIKLDIIQNDITLQSFDIWSSKEGIFPDPKDPRSTDLSRYLNGLTPGVFTFKFYSNAHLPVSVVTDYDPQVNPFIQVRLKTGNISQVPLEARALNSEIVNTIDINEFYAVWGMIVPAYTPYDRNMPNNSIFIADLNGNGQVGAEDFSLIIANQNEGELIMPMTEELCKKMGYEWIPMHNGPDAPMMCKLPTTDAGARCTDSDQCDSYCEAPDGTQSGAQVVGACYEWMRANCMQSVEDGTADGMWCE